MQLPPHLKAQRGGDKRNKNALKRRDYRHPVGTFDQMMDRMDGRSEPVGTFDQMMDRMDGRSEPVGTFDQMMDRMDGKSEPDLATVLAM